MLARTSWLLLLLLGCAEPVAPLDLALPLDGGADAAPHAALDAALSPWPDDAGLALLDAAPGVDAANVQAPLLLDCPADRLGFVRLPVGKLKLNVGCQGSGRVALLLHGYPEFHGAWSKLTPHLLAAGYRVVVPDQRGYNLSDKPGQVADYQLDRLVDDALAVIRATGEARVLLVGHDWGGTVGWVVAHRRPELLRALVVLSGPHPDIWADEQLDPVQAEASAKYVPLVAGPLGELPFAIPELYFDGLLAGHLTQAELEAYHAAWAIPDAPVSMNNWYRANLHPTKQLPRNVTVSVPTLVFWGLADTFTTPSQLAHLPRFVSNLKVVTWPGADHWIEHQHSAETAREILAIDPQP